MICFKYYSKDIKLKARKLIHQLFDFSSSDFSLVITKVPISIHCVTQKAQSSLFKWQSVFLRLPVYFIVWGYYELTGTWSEQGILLESFRGKCTSNPPPASFFVASSCTISCSGGTRSWVTSELSVRSSSSSPSSSSANRGWLTSDRCPMVITTRPPALPRPILPPPSPPPPLHFSSMPSSLSSMFIVMVTGCQICRRQSWREGKMWRLFICK